jgi:CheY-like chemotaxis protein
MSSAAKMIREQQNLLPQNSPVPNRRILVVDDEPAIGDGIRRILTPAASTPAPAARSSRNLKAVGAPEKVAQVEFDVVVVTNPADALQALQQSLDDRSPFALGFFDVMLGAEMDGIQLVKKIMALDLNLYAVFVTAYQDRTVDSIGAILGEENRERWDYINKPFTEGEILQKARTVSSLWDLHRLKEWQQERLSEANQRLLQHERQTAVAAVGRSVAHEFGNLLTHIVGNAELSLEKGGEAALRSAMEVILKASDTAANILKRFRTLHGSMEFVSKPGLMDLQQTVSEALELVEFQFRKRQI